MSDDESSDGSPSRILLNGGMKGLKQAPTASKQLDFRSYVAPPPPIARPTVDDDGSLEFSPEASMPFFLEAPVVADKSPDCPRSAIQRTVDPTKMLKRDLLPLCAKEGIELEKGMNLPEIQLMVKSFFLQLHETEGSNVHESSCYVAERQSIDRQRQLTTAQRKQLGRMEKQEQRSPDFLAGLQNKKPRFLKKKKSATVDEILKEFTGEPFFIVRHNKSCILKCGCNQKAVSGSKKDLSSVKRHLNSKKHKDHVAELKINHHQQVRLVLAAKQDAVGDHLAAAQQDTGETGLVTQMAIDASRASSVSDDDKYFRLRLTRAFVGAGLPLSAINKLRGPLEELCSRPLASSGALSHDYISKIIATEEELQVEELMGKKIALCFDATPRMGDVFALIARYVETKEGMSIILSTTSCASFPL